MVFASITGTRQGDGKPTRQYATCCYEIYHGFLWYNSNG